MRFPHRFWPLLTPRRFAAAAGLAIGIRIRPLALLTAVALVCYFVVAIDMHVRGADFGHNLFLNATGMHLICSALLAWLVLAG